MSHYTTEVRYICETYAGLSESVGYNKVDEIISKARPQIFDFSYPIFDESYRSVLETKIIRHYYGREICAETVGRWKLYLQTMMNEIMPFYNKMYMSELLKFNPLYDVDMYTEHQKDGSGTNNLKSNTDTTADNWRYMHDTPQGGVEGLKSLNYLTEAERENDKGNSKTNTDGEYTDTETYLQHVYGKSVGKSFSKMLMEYRDTFLNIDMLIINDLEELFFGLW